MPSLGNQEYIRDMNSRLVLKEIIHKEPLSRAEISKNLGLTKATVSSIVQDFIRKGYVAEIGSLDTDKGRKPILLKFDADCAFTLSVYLNVDATSVLIANLRGQNRQTFSYPAITDAASPSDRLAGYIRDAMTHCPPSRYGIIGIAVGVLGVVHNNTIAFTPYYTIDRPELGSYLSERFGIPVYVENEANFSAQGEWAFFHSYPSLININIHAGIGMGIILHNHLHTGLNGYAGEFGHTIIDPDGIPCPCGNRGCIEQYASERAITARFREMKGQPSADARALCHAYLHGDADAAACIGLFTRYMAIALNNILNIFNPDIVIINSIFTASIPDLAGRIAGSLRNTFNRGCTFVPASEDQETVILLGGCWVCTRKFLNIRDLKF